jgi:hypothetical protein
MVLLARRTARCHGRSYKPEEIAKLRQVEVLASQGQSMVEAIRAIGVSELIYCRWHQEVGGLKSGLTPALPRMAASKLSLLPT